tara:strand:+ start:316 stop:510 length:195 start_codon:yes stop_codon:yes gene_type:complete
LAIAANSLFVYFGGGLGLSEELEPSEDFEDLELLEEPPEEEDADFLDFFFEDFFFFFIFLSGDA